MSNTELCEVYNCGLTVFCKGMCQKHYNRLRNTGRLDIKSTAERFKEKYRVDVSTGCWVWIASKDKDGYGKHRVKKKDIRAHRYSWFLATGEELRPQQLICHKCDNTSCVNPAHLFVGDHKANHADRGAKGRTARGENCGASKLSTEAVRHIRSSRMGEKAAKDLYGIARSQYYRLVRNIGWEHLNG